MPAGIIAALPDSRVGACCQSCLRRVMLLLPHCGALLLVALHVNSGTSVDSNYDLAGPDIFVPVFSALPGLLVASAFFLYGYSGTGGGSPDCIKL